jgi:hypothetical protein
MALGGHKRNRLYAFKQEKSKTEDVHNENVLMKQRLHTRKDHEYNGEEEEDDDDDEDEGNDSDEESDEEFDDLAIATGVDTNCAVDMVDMMRLAEENDLNFVCVPLFHPRIRTGETTEL